MGVTKSTVCTRQRSSETRDDAAVTRVSDDLCLVQTVDFVTPIVDSPYWFGQLAAANALSDVYAMGARPLTAMNLVAWPADLGMTHLVEILEGGAEKVMEAGADLAGGHSIDDREPKYGLAVTGVARPDEIVYNAGQHADAEALGEHQLVAGPRASVVDDLVGTGHAGDGQPVLGFPVVDGVPAGELGAGLHHLLGAALEDLHQVRHAEVGRPRHEVHGSKRPRAHGVHVAERVGRGELPEPVGRIDDGRDEVDRLHQAEVVGDARDGGVVARLEQPRELRGAARESVKHGLQVARTQLGRSTALGCELREADLVGHTPSLPHVRGREWGAAPHVR